MKFYSTNKKSPEMSLEKVIFRGLAEDGGLFMPKQIPKFPPEFFQKIHSLSFQEISFEVAKKFLKNDIPDKALREIVCSAVNFDAPLVRINKNIYTLELSHGPTLSFKDFGARFMARLFSYFLENSKKEVTVLTATSGDTGSAVANGFLDINGTKVVLLYPSGKVSCIQEQQFTTLNKNIIALEVKGAFDDCQTLVKHAFTDKELNKALALTSANSINIARLLPQSFYYFWAYAKLIDKTSPLIFAVPSGNFGNLTGGLLAKKMGLPVKKFIAATNINNTVPKFLQTGIFRPKKPRKTISNAMDVGNPSNFARILDLYDNDLEKIKKDIRGASFSDAQTKKAINHIFKKYDYIMDPHGAIGYLALTEYLKASRQPINGVFLETAHASKFSNIIEPVINKKIETPARLQKALKAKKQSIAMPNNFKAFKNFLLNR